jgi:hypothetical protein
MRHAFPLWVLFLGICALVAVAYYCATAPPPPSMPAQAAAYVGRVTGQPAATLACLYRTNGHEYGYQCDVRSGGRVYSVFCDHSGCVTNNAGGTP